MKTYLNHWKEKILKIGEIYFAEKIGDISRQEVGLIKKAIALILDIEPEDCL